MGVCTHAVLHLNIMRVGKHPPYYFYFEKGKKLSSLDLAALFLLIGVPFLAFATLWQMYVILTESYTLNQYQNQPQKMLWVAISLFFSFSLSVYWFCPNARKKGIIFLILGVIGTVSYGLSMYYKSLALA